MGYREDAHLPRLDSIPKDQFHTVLANTQQQQTPDQMDWTELRP